MVSMRFLSLSLLRLSIPILSIILIHEMCHCPFREFFGGVVEEEESVVDVAEVTPLNDRVARLLRLHEMLARPQKECGKELRGEDPEDFFICPQGYSQVGRSGLSISMSSLWKGHFESIIPVHSWTVITGPKERFTHRLKNATVERVRDVMEWREWHIHPLTTSIHPFLHVDTALFNLYDGRLRPNAQLVLALITHYSPRLAFLVARVNDEEEADMWHSLLHDLFYRSHYALIAATSSGVCGRIIQTCEYRISLIRFDPLLDIVLPPPYNLGSPLEERHRLLSFVKSLSVPCEKVIHSSLPSFCASSLHHNSSALLLSYLPYPSFPDLTPLHPSNIIIASPHACTPPATCLLVAVSPDGVNGTSNEGWSLRALPSLLQQVSLLLVDLDGTEWDVIHHLSTYLIHSSIPQIAMTVRLFVEEDETIRRFFWSLRRVQLSGYTLTTVSTEPTRMRLILIKNF